MYLMRSHVFVVCVFLARLMLSTGEYPFQDPSLGTAGVDDLVNRPTLDELVSHSLAIHNRDSAGLPRLGVPAYQWITGVRVHGT